MDAACGLGSVSFVFWRWRSEIDKRRSPEVSVASGGFRIGERRVTDRRAAEVRSESGGSCLSNLLQLERKVFEELRGKSSTPHFRLFVSFLSFAISAEIFQGRLVLVTDFWSCSFRSYYFLGEIFISSFADQGSVLSSGPKSSRDSYFVFQRGNYCPSFCRLGVSYLIGEIFVRFFCRSILSVSIGTQVLYFYFFPSVQFIVLGRE